MLAEIFLLQLQTRLRDAALNRVAGRVRDPRFVPVAPRS